MINEIDVPAFAAQMAAEVAAISKLRAVSPQLKAGDASFAKSLLDQFAAKGKLTPKQWSCVDSLTERATKVATGPLSAAGVVKSFGDAIPAKAANPAVLIAVGAAGEGGVIRLSRPRNGGAYLRLQWKPADGSAGWVFVGTVRPNDEVRLNLGFVVGADAGAIVAALAAFGSDMLASLKVTGKALGVCANCGRTLTHPASIAFGIGPVCADHLGLGAAYAAAAASVAGAK